MLDIFTIVVIPVLLHLTAITAAVNDQRLWVGDSHFKYEFLDVLRVYFEVIDKL
jgi:hypothetical protein